MRTCKRKKYKKRRILSLVLTLCLLFAMVPGSAFAEDGGSVESVTEQEAVTETVTETATEPESDPPEIQSEPPESETAQPETQPPETEALTEAQITEEMEKPEPVTETDLAEPETDAPETEEETDVSETETENTEPETEAVTEVSETEAETEEPLETEAKEKQTETLPEMLPEPDNTRLIRAALELVQETKEEGENPDDTGNELLQTLLPFYFPDETLADPVCMEIAAAVYYAGADDLFPCDTFQKTFRYLRSASAVWFYAGTGEEVPLRSGDLLIFEESGKERIAFYAGNDLIREKYPDWRTASILGRTDDPDISFACLDMEELFPDGGYEVFRYVGDYQGTKRQEALTFLESLEETEAVSEEETESITEDIPEPDTEIETETAAGNETELQTEEETETEPETEVSTEVQTEEETEIQTEEETETEPESEPETEFDTESETETDTEAESEIESETETEEETETETETETESETESETATESESESETEMETESDSETESETETDTENHAQTETEGVSYVSLTVSMPEIADPDLSFSFDYDLYIPETSADVLIEPNPSVAETEKEPSNLIEETDGEQNENTDLPETQTETEAPADTDQNLGENISSDSEKETGTNVDTNVIIVKQADKEPDAEEKINADEPDTQPDESDSEPMENTQEENESIPDPSLEEMREHTEVETEEAANAETEALAKEPETSVSENTDSAEPETSLEEENKPGEPLSESLSDETESSVSDAQEEEIKPEDETETEEDLLLAPENPAEEETPDEYGSFLLVSGESWVSGPLPSGSRYSVRLTVPEGYTCDPCVWEGTVSDTDVVITPDIVPETGFLFDGVPVSEEYTWTSEDFPFSVTAVFSGEISLDRIVQETETNAQEKETSANEDILAEDKAESAEDSASDSIDKNSANTDKEDLPTETDAESEDPSADESGLVSDENMAEPINEDLTDPIQTESDVLLSEEEPEQTDDLLEDLDPALSDPVLDDDFTAPSEYDVSSDIPSPLTFAVTLDEETPDDALAGIKLHLYAGDLDLDLSSCSAVVTLSADLEGLADTDAVSPAEDEEGKGSEENDVMLTSFSEDDIKDDTLSSLEILSDGETVGSLELTKDASAEISLDDASEDILLIGIYESANPPYTLQHYLWFPHV